MPHFCKTSKQLLFLVLQQAWRCLNYKVVYLAWGKLKAFLVSPSQLVLWLALFLCQFAQAYEVTDSFGKHRFDQPPKRVVVTDWALLEQILELKVSSVIGAPEIERYRRYVKQPLLPSGITDIGLRRSPSLEKIKSLKPDLIILGTDQKNLARIFSRVAKVMYYKSFSDKYRTNGKKSRLRFLQIAELFQKRPLAETKLAAMDKEITAIRTALHKRFNGQLPKTTLIRFSSQEKCLVYGKNGMPYHAQKLIGLESDFPLGRSKWGEKEIKLKQLSAVDEGYIIYIKPLPDKGSSKALLELRKNKNTKIRSIEPVWSYGGAMSVLYNARAISAALDGD